MEIKLGVDVIFIFFGLPNNSDFLIRSGFRKEKWTVMIRDAIFFVWFSSCYMPGMYDII